MPTPSETSDFFDAIWYLHQYPDVALAKMDAARHYLLHGVLEGRRPAPQFDEGYIPSIEQQAELLRQCTWFDAEWYLQQYADVADAGADAALHFLMFGREEGRLPCPVVEVEPSASYSDEQGALLESSKWFDPDWYLQRYPDVATSAMSAVDHYLHFGAAEGRQPGPLFDEAFYLSQLNAPLDYPSGLLHYLNVGKQTGFKPVPDRGNGPWWQGMSPATFQLDLQVLQDLHDQPLPVVIVPVFNAATSLANCLASLKQHRQGVAQVIIIDDASTDPAVSELLDQCEGDPFIACYKNERNLGFSGTVNRGIELAGDADVILLNSDTKVTRGFAQRLRLTAYGGGRVATVTPLSNNAGPFSVPFPSANQVPAHFGLERFALVIRQAAVSAPISVPTGHGFCMFIRRAALQEAGIFDAEAFPRGYGEENDFCRRSAALGWLHVIDPRTYIFHEGSASFAAEKQSLLSSGRAILDQRYPDYSVLVKECFEGKNIEVLRRRIAALAHMPVDDVQGVKPRILYVISTVTGGTPQTNQDLMRALGDEYECFVLRCDSETVTLRHFMKGIYTNLKEHRLSQPIQALPHTNDEYDQIVASWLAEWSIDLVHVRHLGWHSLGLLSVVKTLGIELIHSFHDFYTLCPTVKLLDNNQQYCAATCTQGEGTCVHELWPVDAFSRLKHDQIHQWQARFAQVLQACDGFVTTNLSAKELILNRYPGLAQKPFEVIPHGRDFGYFDDLAVEPVAGEKLRILCPGNISEAKGLRLIQELALRRQDVEIHILGVVTYDLPLSENVIIHGPYVREHFYRRVAQIKPHCGAVLSIWPETWCHTLTEMWAGGIPVIGIDMGAVGDRIRESNAGWLLRDNTVSSLEEVVNTVVLPMEWKTKMRSLKAWQANEGKNQTCREMARSYDRLYKLLTNNM